MANYFISPEKEKAIRAKMTELLILEKDLEEQFVRGSGKGGQKKNKTSNCVILKHVPSGLSVRSEEYREKVINQFMARRRLCEMVEEKLYGKKSSRQKEIEKKRKQKKRTARKRNAS